MKQILCTTLAVGVVLMTACRREPASPNPEPGPAPVGVVSVDGTALLRADLEFELSRRSGRREESAFDAVLEEIVQRQRLVAEARRLGLDREPATRRALEGILIARLKERQLEPRFLLTNAAAVSGPWPSTTSIDSVPQPGMLSQVAWLRLQFNPRTSATRRDALRTRMTEARNRALSLEPGIPGFGPLAVEYSDDDATRSAGGDLGWLSPTSTGLPGGDAVRRAMAGLQKPGEISPVIEGADGFYLLRLIGRRETVASGAAGRREAAVAAHRSQIDRRRSIEQDYLDEIRARIPVVYHTNAIEEVRAAWRGGGPDRGEAPPGDPGGSPP